MDHMLCRARTGLVVVVVAMVSVACTSSGSDDGTTTTPDPPLTTLSVPGETQPPDDSTTTTSTPKMVLTAPGYTIVDRIDGEGAGDTVIVLLEAGTYDSLNDIDLYDLIAEVVELFPPIAVVHVVDDAAAANIVANPDASEAELEAVATNYLARLDNGFQITFLGPFVSAGTAVLGS